MAQSRMVSTSFWKDSYIIELEPKEKLLFLYLLTNDRTNMAGIYELSVREACFDTDLDRKFVEHCLGKFVKDNKMHYEKNWLVLFNFTKHQRQNPSIKTGIKNSVALLPDWLKQNLQLLEDDKKVSIIYGGQLQLVDSLGTTTPQKKLIEAKEIKVNIKEAKETKSNSIAARPDHLKNVDSEIPTAGYLAAKKQAQLIKQRAT